MNFLIFQDLLIGCENNPSNITLLEYFDETVDLKGRDIGRPKEISSKVQKFKVNFFLFK